MTSLSSLRPPTSVLHPFIVLDTFLQQQQQQQAQEKGSAQELPEEPTDAVGTNETLASKEKLELLPLRVAFSLFGASFVDNALASLEECHIHEIQAVTSRRRMFILTKRKRNGPKNSSSNNNEPNSYFCLLPQCLPSSNNNNDNQHHQEANTTVTRRGILYCSCRAYFQISKSTATQSSPFLVCKHLLALKLRPVIQDSSSFSSSSQYYQKTETATEEQFSEQVLMLMGCGDGGDFGGM